MLSCGLSIRYYAHEEDLGETKQYSKYLKWDALLIDRSARVYASWNRVCNGGWLKVKRLFDKMHDESMRVMNKRWIVKFLDYLERFKKVFEILFIEKFVEYSMRDIRDFLQ